jgi:4-hydroxybenzoate polyprenyltransferase
MRGAGCSINDFVDRNLDRQVERTRYRPLAAGAVSVPHALVFTGVQLALGSLVWLQLNTVSKILAFSSLALVAAYPFMKRLTSWVRASAATVL